ncbi:DUF1232 domain-containing protein [Brevibacillus ruminantium]|uniref:DUF1232 domain-containing protein n=1 Tax=Brevibacillus ruminantium TaxID=2950604 RepID=A0ABY4WPF4_9BACL|nr:DUF1232 domain-containing protein [Brevibacillus ruminantium]USG67279.1 DUF1232 domain-containing protein [Brevibacillus ruminantium]
MNQDQQEPKSSDHLPAVQSPRELIPIKLPEEHQRFYDKLRAKIEAFIRERSGNEAVAKYVLLAPDLFVLLARLLVDKRIGLQSKALAGAAVAYFISPIDFIPEAVVGPVGLLDDVVFAVFALRKILVDTDEKIVKEHWNGEEDLLRVITSVIRSADNLLGKKLVKKIEQALFRKK